MGILLSICFKAKDGAGTAAHPQHQIKKQRSVLRDKAPHKHLLLGGDSTGPGRPQNYSSTQAGPPPPPKFPGFGGPPCGEPGEAPRSGWPKPPPGVPGSPAYMEHNAAPGAFMTPPPSPRDEAGKARGFAGLRASSQDGGGHRDSHKFKRSFKRKK